MHLPGINTYFPHYHALWKASKVLLMVIKTPAGESKKENPFNIQMQLVPSFIMTMFAVLECFTNELEDSIESGGMNLPYNRLQRPDIRERVSILYSVITGKNLNKGTTIHADFVEAVKIRNLITHASGEHITWSKFDIMPVGESIRTNDYHFNEEDFKRMRLEGEVSRNNCADKIIKYLAGKDLVPKYYKGRSTGWLHYISFPKVAHWFFAAIMNYIGPMIMEYSKSTNNHIMQFGIGAQRTFFDDIIEKYKPIKYR